MITQIRRRRTTRRGTTVVETAVVLPVFLTFLFAIFEFGHAQMVNNMLNSACRAAARVGSVEGTTSADVIARINQTMSPVISPDNVTIFVNDASVYDSGGSTPTSPAELEELPSIELSEAEPRQMFVVRARLNYNDIALIPMSFLDGVVLNSQAFMRHE
ncbi:MAG: TadE family protein [Planctomycetota bacterium]